MRALSLALFSTLLAIPASADSDWHEAKIFSVKSSEFLPGETWVTLRVPSEIRLNNWYTCEFWYKGEVVASIRHVLRQRVPTTAVEIDASKVQLVLCSEQ
jgi:hypothetical protein